MLLLSRSGSIFVPRDVEVDVPVEAFSSLSDNALAWALCDFPRFNASMTSDGKKLVLKGYVHIGIAVDAEHGLIVLVI